ncbi:AfsR/SARP family transcriptional regulator, partial [Pseudokineococcus marinus]
MSALPRLGVLGPTTAWDAGGRELRLPGPRHRELLVRLAVARGAVVPVAVLVEDLWGAAGPDDERGRTAAVRTFVAALRRALEPDRTPRAPARVLRTKGPGYALHLPGRALDATAFEEDVALESAGITLLQADLTALVRARRLSRATMGNIRQNLVFAFV